MPLTARVSRCWTGSAVTARPRPTAQRVPRRDSPSAWGWRRQHEERPQDVTPRADVRLAGRGQGGADPASTAGLGGYSVAACSLNSRRLPTWAASTSRIRGVVEERRQAPPVASPAGHQTSRSSRRPRSPRRALQWRRLPRGRSGRSSAEANWRSCHLRRWIIVTASSVPMPEKRVPSAGSGPRTPPAAPAPRRCTDRRQPGSRSGGSGPAGSRARVGG